MIHGKGDRRATALIDMEISMPSARRTLTSTPSRHHGAPQHQHFAFAGPNCLRPTAPRRVIGLPAARTTSRNALMIAAWLPRL